MRSASEHAPETGLVFGLRWGEGLALARARFPEGRVEIDADITRLRPSLPITLAALRWRLEYEFSLDYLSAVTLTLVGGPEQLAGAGLLATARAWHLAPLERVDEGLWRAESSVTALTIDLLEGRLTFSDSEAP